MRSLPRKIYGHIRSSLPLPVKAVLRGILVKAKQYRARRVINAPAVPAAARRRYTATDRQVVFISAVPRVREAKLAHGLRSRGWTVILLHGEEPNYPVHKYFDGAEHFADGTTAVRLALKYTPVAYHVFSPSGDMASTEVILASVGPTVFDATDLLEISYLGNPDNIERVRHAIELQVHSILHADGYCARDLQLQFAERKLGYRRHGPVVYFPEYCWDLGNEEKVLVRVRQHVRCVQAGNFGIEKLGESDWGYLALAEKLIAAGIGLDIYPNWTHFARGEREFANVFSDYLALARRSDLFHLHRPVAAEMLVDALRPYDFGFYLVTGEFTGERIHSLNPEIMAHCMGARVFDYLDAGLPVVLNKSFRLVHAMLDRYGAAIGVGADFLGRLEQILTPHAAAAMRKSAVRARRALSLARHAHRLESFYSRLAAEVGLSLG